MSTALRDIRCVLYLRVSSPKQVDGTSLESQEHDGRAYAARMGWAVKRVYIEAGRSAYTENLKKRLAFQEMLADARAGHFDVVLIYKLNRFARNVPVQYQAAADLEQCGVQIASVTEPIERKTASGRATFGMLAVMAQLQSDQLGEKMRDTRLAEARQGRHTGPVPLGFAREHGQLIPTTQIGAPQLAFELYASRQYSFATIADALNQAGWATSTGRLFTKFQVEEMLKNPVYIGRVRCKEQEFPGLHGAVIDQGIWDAVQSEIARRGATADHSHRAAREPALLSDLARCSNCGAIMWRGGADGAYYRCSRQLANEPLDAERKLRCNMRGVQAAAAEAHVLISLIALTGDQTLLTAVTAELQGLAAQEPTPQPIRDIKQIRERERRLVRLYELGMKTDTEFETELAILRGQLAAATSINPAGTTDVQRAMAFVGNVPMLVVQATDKERRQLLQEVFDVIYLTPHQAMAVRPAAQYVDILKALDQSSAFNQMFVWWAGWGSNPRHSA
jgi:site-specific DNA recombinase